VIHNIRTIARKLEAYNFAINTPYRHETTWHINIFDTGTVWLYIDTAWKRRYQKHEDVIKKAFRAYEVNFVDNGDQFFWAVLLKHGKDGEDY